MAVLARATELLLRENAELVSLKLCASPVCRGEVWFIRCLKFMLHDLGVCKKKGDKGHLLWGPIAPTTISSKKLTHVVM